MANKCKPYCLIPFSFTIAFWRTTLNINHRQMKNNLKLKFPKLTLVTCWNMKTYNRVGSICELNHFFSSTLHCSFWGKTFFTTYKWKIENNGGLVESWGVYDSIQSIQLNKIHFPHNVFCKAVMCGVDSIIFERYFKATIKKLESSLLNRSKTIFKIHIFLWRDNGTIRIVPMS